jgi:hypothetical protein
MVVGDDFNYSWKQFRFWRFKKKNVICRVKQTMRCWAWSGFVKIFEISDWRLDAAVFFLSSTLTSCLPPSSLGFNFYIFSLFFKNFYFNSIIPDWTHLLLWTHNWNEDKERGRWNKLSKKKKKTFSFFFPSRSLATHTARYLDTDTHFDRKNGSENNFVVFSSFDVTLTNPLRRFFQSSWASWWSTIASPCLMSRLLKWKSAQ